MKQSIPVDYRDRQCIKYLDHSHVYTAWGFWFSPDNPYNPEMPGFNPQLRAGGGSIGANDGSMNRFDADADGNGSITLDWLPGLSSFGDIDVPAWALDTSQPYSDFVIVGAYHYDELTHGTVPGPAHAGQFIAQFAVPEPSSIALAFFAATGFGVFRPRRRRSSLAEPTAQLNR